MRYLGLRVTPNFLTGTWTVSECYRTQHGRRYFPIAKGFERKAEAAAFVRAVCAEIGGL